MELYDEVMKVSSALSKKGLSKGDVVTLFSANCIEWVVSYLAAGLTGATVSAVNPAYTVG